MSDRATIRETTSKSGTSKTCSTRCCAAPCLRDERAMLSTQGHKVLTFLKKWNGREVVSDSQTQLSTATMLTSTRFNYTFGSSSRSSNSSSSSCHSLEIPRAAVRHSQCPHHQCPIGLVQNARHQTTLNTRLSRAHLRSLKRREMAWDPQSRVHFHDTRTWPGIVWCMQRQFQHNRQCYPPTVLSIVAMVV